MVRAMLNWITCCAIAGYAFAHPLGARQLDTPLDPIQFKKLYVEPLSVKTGSGKLRADMISQLRKVSSLSIVSNKADADAVLSGNGEIWVKGYVSLNPRSGRVPSDGTPVYTGFLSVEIKDARGVTLWSYLATPESESQDISKELSKRIARHLAAVLNGEPVTPAQRH
jgi:hypothetical protein